MATTRLGLYGGPRSPYGGPRSPYGSFAGKTAEVVVPDATVPEQFGKKWYELNRERLSLQMRQEDEEILALIQIIGKYLL
tara:strand:+ start:1082 stop:1321 length:240 start_codon:yes stop_codon:yes gene_type:complete